MFRAEGLDDQQVAGRWSIDAWNRGIHLLYLANQLSGIDAAPGVDEVR